MELSIAQRIRLAVEVEMDQYSDSKRAPSSPRHPLFQDVQLVRALSAQRDGHGDHGHQEQSQAAVKTVEGAICDSDLAEVLVADRCL